MDREQVNGEGVVLVVEKPYMQAYMENAISWANTSEATRLKVGCVIVAKDGGIIAQGCNGTPVGWETNTCENETTGETEWFVQHAEVNALNKLRRSNTSSVGSIVFVTHSPCKHCALQMIDAKVTNVYYKYEYRDNTGIDLLKKYGIIVEQM
jgi:dCMP deaminase